MKNDIWVNETVREYYKNYNPIHSLTYKNLCEVYFGVGCSGHFPGGSKSWSSLWINLETGMMPLGIWASRCSGILKHNREYGLLELQNKRIQLYRNGNVLNLCDKEDIIAQISYSKLLRLIYWGSSSLELLTGVKGKIILPVENRAYKAKDVCGCIKFENNCKVNYLINPNDKNIEISESSEFKYPFNKYFYHVSPIYTRESCEILEQICNGDEVSVYTFLCIACWTRMFFSHW